MNENENILLLSSLGKNPKIIEFFKDNNSIKITELNIPKKEEDKHKLNNSSIKNSFNTNNSINNLFGIDLDMPGTNYKKPRVKININNSIKKNEQINRIKEKNDKINNDEENKNIKEMNENNEDKNNNIIGKDNLNEKNKLDLKINDEPKEIIIENNSKKVNNFQINNESNDNNKNINLNGDNINEKNINSNPNKENDLNKNIFNGVKNINTTLNIPDKNQKLIEPDFISKKKIKKKEREIIRNNLAEKDEENY